MGNSLVSFQDTVPQDTVRGARLLLPQPCAITVIPDWVMHPIRAIEAVHINCMHSEGLRCPCHWQCQVSLEVPFMSVEILHSQHKAERVPERGTR